MTPDAGPRGARRRDEVFDRKTLIVSAALLIGAIVLGVGAVALLSDGGDSNSAATTVSVGDGALAPPPAIVPEPNSGTAPSDPGDRGGWEQLVLLALIVAAIVGIVLVVARGGGRRAKANRQAWRDAAAADATRPGDGS